MKYFVLLISLFMFNNAYACGNGECEPHPDEPGIDKPEPEPTPEPEKPTPEPEPEKPTPTPEKPAPTPEPEPEKVNRPERNFDRDRQSNVSLGSVFSPKVAPITDQTYIPSEKWEKTMVEPQVCEKQGRQLRYSVPVGMTKEQARQRCIEWLE